MACLSRWNDNFIAGIVVNTSQPVYSDPAHPEYTGRHSRGNLEPDVFVYTTLWRVLVVGYACSPIDLKPPPQSDGLQG